MRNWITQKRKLTNFLVQVFAIIFVGEEYNFSVFIISPSVDKEDSKRSWIIMFLMIDSYLRKLPCLYHRFVGEDLIIQFNPADADLSFTKKGLIYDEMK